MKRFLISCLGSFVLLSCGISNHNDSHLKDVTDPSEQVVGSAREFWYYEAEVDGLNAAAHRLKDSAVTYFPESYTTGDDFFWTFLNSPISLSNLEFKLSMDPEISRSVPVMNNVAANGQIVSMQLTPDSLSQILEYPRWQIDFQPVFHVKAKGAAIPLELTVSIKNVCYNPHFFDVDATLELDQMIFDSMQVEKVFQSSLNDQSNVLQPVLEYRPAQVKGFLAKCKEKNGEIASSLILSLSAQGNGFDLEFSGIKTNMVIYAN